jgi:hypothetical protein
VQCAPITLYILSICRLQPPLSSCSVYQLAMVAEAPNPLSFLATLPAMPSRTVLCPALTCFASRYRATYVANPAAYKVPTKTGGGYWFEERQRQAAGNTAPSGCGNSSTTYAAEMLQGEQTQQQKKQLVEGLPSTLVKYQVARDHRCGGLPARTARS